MRIKEKFDKNKVFFTSDTHFHHTNIIRFCNRPWGNIETHDAALVANWNNTVPKDGIVFHLGDFVFTSNVDYIRSLVSQLNGKIFLIIGNHDYQNRLDRDVTKEIFGNRVYDIVELTVWDDTTTGGHNNFHLSHFPFMFWHRGSYHLHGHVHSGINSNSSEKVPEHCMRFDVGVDNNDYKPLSYNNLMKIFKIKEENFYLK